MAELLTTRFIGTASYTPPPIKTQPIVYPPAPVPPGTSVAGSPMPRETTFQTGSLLPDHIIASGPFIPTLPVSGISEGVIAGAIPSSFSVAPIRQYSQPSDYSSYLIIGVVILLVFFLFRTGE